MSLCTIAKPFVWYRDEAFDIGEMVRRKQTRNSDKEVKKEVEIDLGIAKLHNIFSCLFSA